MTIRGTNKIAIAEERVVTFIKGEGGDVESSSTEADETKQEEENEGRGYGFRNRAA